MELEKTVAIAGLILALLDYTGLSRKSEPHLANAIAFLDRAMQDGMNDKWDRITDFAHNLWTGIGDLANGLREFFEELWEAIDPLLGFVVAIFIASVFMTFGATLAVAIALFLFLMAAAIPIIIAVWFTVIGFWLIATSVYALFVSGYWFWLFLSKIIVFPAWGLCFLIKVSPGHLFGLLGLIVSCISVVFTF